MKKLKGAGSKVSQLRNKSGWGGAGGRALRPPPAMPPPAKRHMVMIHFAM